MSFKVLIRKGQDFFAFQDNSSNNKEQHIQRKRFKVTLPSGETVWLAGENVSTATYQVLRKSIKSQPHRRL